ncbi:MAG: multidrug effflux MFS transporter [Litorimonas sp.]
MPQKDDILRKSTDIKLPIPLWEFVAMIAAFLALNALAIDTMLPALGHVGDFYKIKDPNDQQLIIFSYILGFGFPQLFFGPLSDRLGRKVLLQTCLVGFAIAGLCCMLAGTFSMLLTLRFLQGVFAAGIRVIASAIVRDVTAGRVMARIMSLVFTVFMIVPIIAPAIGTLILAFLSWKWTFGMLGVAGAIMFVWTQFRLPATLPPDNRQPLNVKHITASYMTVLSNRVSFGYMIASGLAFGALFAFIGSSEQLMDEVYHQGDKFWIWFAVISSGIGVASLVNAKIVERVGMRRISHSVLILFIVSSGLNLVLQYMFGPVFWIFLPLFTLTFGCFGMMGANFSSLALEPLGEIAGTASAVYGFATSTLSALIGLAIAKQFDGSVLPILTGFVGLGLASFVVVLWTEHGKLFEHGVGKT